MSKKPSKILRRYAWIPDVPDARDVEYKVAAPRRIPSVFDLRPKMNKVPVLDQGDLGSCTANAITAALEFLRVVSGRPNKYLSRLFVYFNERLKEGTVNQDAGAQIRDGIKSVAKQGACLETTWPYDVKKFKAKPTAGCYAEATRYKATEYQRVTSTSDMLQVLASGVPVVFGISVYESFESDEVARTGIVPFPDLDNERMIGGHAVLAVGYDKKMKIGSRTGAIIVRNSWGSKWGDKGYFYLPIDYVSNKNMADDFWAITACLFE